VKATSNTLNMGAESIPETLENLQTLTLVSAREHFMELYIFTDFEIRNFVAANMLSEMHFFHEVQLLISF
jgi:hypothetical protein